MINSFLNNQMYALCILAALSLRQHVQQNWQIYSTTTRRTLLPQPSFNFMKYIEPSNSQRTEKVGRNYKNIEESNDQEDNESKSQDFLYSCFKKLTGGAQRIINNIGVSIEDNNKNTSYHGILLMAPKELTAVLELEKNLRVSQIPM